MGGPRRSTSRASAVQVRVVLALEVAASDLARVPLRAPAARRPGLQLRLAALVEERHRRLGAVDDPLQRAAQQRLAHRFLLQAPAVEVVGGEQPGRHAEAQRLDERVEAEVLAVAGGEAAGLQVDEHLAGPQPLGPPDREVDLARTARCGRR